MGVAGMKVSHPVSGKNNSISRGNTALAGATPLSRQGKISTMAIHCMRLRANSLVLALSAALAVPGTWAATWVYVSNADSQDVSVFELDRSAATLKPVETLPLGGRAGHAHGAVARQKTAVCGAALAAISGGEPGHRPRQRQVAQAG